VLAPVEVVEIELGEALPRLRPAPGARTGTARALVRVHGRPLGLVDLPLPPGGLGPDACARLVWSELRAEIAAHLAGDGLAPVTTLTADGLPTARGPAPCGNRQWGAGDAPLPARCRSGRGATATRRCSGGGPAASWPASAP